MRRGWWAIILVVLGLSSLRALASASPPDPLWIPGVYDDADYDDVVSAVLSLDGFREDPPPVLGRPAPVVVLGAASGLTAPPSSPRPSEDSRAPPAS